MKEIATDRGLTLQDLVTEINAGRERGNLSSAIRLLVLAFYQQEITSLSGSQPKRIGGEFAAL
jgi:predicted DNA-binding ribbon-helix-helix protein